MDNMKEFAESAKSLSKSPLGIIALFLVLVYAVASLVISVAKPEFFQNAYHPVVIFLSTFPVVVLFVFAYLVSRHHEKLYAPYDYKDQTHFFKTLRIPQAVSTSTPGIATSDQTGIAASLDIQSEIDTSYKELVAFGLSLIHEAEVVRKRTSPKSGRYRVRVWLEVLEHRVSLSDIESVTYRVWDDFKDRTQTTTNAASNFDLWLNVYGEFPILALIKKTDGSTFQLQRYLDLPGRPPD